VQRATWVLAFAFGLVAISPWWLASWQDWRKAQATQTQFESLLTNTQELRRQTIQMQTPVARASDVFMGTSEISQLAHLSALTSTAVSMDRALTAASLEGLQIQQWPIQLHLTGSWAAWLGWLSQWASAMPSVTLTGLDLRADTQGGVSAQVDLLSPRVSVPALTVAPMDNSRLSAVLIRDPVDVKAWRKAQVQYGQQHPSYALHAAPEMRRVRQALEDFPRQQLRYVGHLSTADEMQALVQVAAIGSKDSAVSSPLAIHRVRVGDRLGQDFGQVLRVEKHQMQLRELTVGPQGEWQLRQVSMPLEASP
jgi:Tfp pilus assembly protein PilP